MSPTSPPRATTTAFRWHPFALGADEYFVMGDNRDNSHDSRNYYGAGRPAAITRKDIVGKVRFVMWAAGPCAGRGVSGARGYTDPQVGIPPNGGAEARGPGGGFFCGERSGFSVFKKGRTWYDEPRKGPNLISRRKPAMNEVIRQLGGAPVGARV